MALTGYLNLQDFAAVHGIGLCGRRSLDVISNVLSAKWPPSSEV